MDFGFTFLSALYYYTIISQHMEGVENLLIIDDQPTVDKLARKYAKHKGRWTTAIKNIRNVSKEKESAGICECDPRKKVAFCGRVLPMAFFGFQFKDWDDEAFVCKPYVFWISERNPLGERNTFWKRRGKKPKEKHYTLDMYSCPDIFYRDIESDMNIPIDERYLVSRGQEENSAILFVQKHKNKSDDKIYPRKYVENIVLQILALGQRVNANMLLQIQKPDLTFTPISIEEELIAYMEKL